MIDLFKALSSIEPPSEDQLEGEVHLWRLEMQMKQHYLEALGMVLDGDERRRAEGIGNPLERERFIWCRTALRIVLGWYLKRSARGLAFQYNDHGKPTLAADIDSAIRFNLSHSDMLALIAVTAHHSVGVDIEWMGRTLDVGEMLLQYFTVEEQKGVFERPFGERKPLFYRMWTCKEACLKAVGVGLEAGQGGLEIAGLARQMSRKIGSAGQLNHGKKSWTYKNIEPAHGYAGAVAREGANFKTRYYEL